jgi:2-polyprenyl-3-methyl-5-hydroxy-6-metoxy-1,4-benzoquinol methylase
LTIVDHLLSVDSKVLDFGAGEGELAQAMCERGLRVAAYEPSPKRRSILSERLSRFPGFLGTIGDGDAGEYDAIVMTEVIEHVLENELRPCLTRVHGLLRPGGTLIVTTPNTEDLELNMVFCPLSGKFFHRWQHMRSFTPHSLIALLRDAGFKEVVTHRMQLLEELFLPFDRIWGTGVPRSNWPAYMHAVRDNAVGRVGQESTIVYVGTRID